MRKALELLPDVVHCVDATKVREKLGNKRTGGSRRRYQIGFKDAKVA
jgi:hypothetical protein